MKTLTIEQVLMYQVEFSLLKFLLKEKWVSISILWYTMSFWWKPFWISNQDKTTYIL